MVLAIIMWCLCALVGAYICRPKNREQDGIVLGLFLGPLGVVIALMLKPAAPKVADAPAHAFRFKYNCPRCQRPLTNSRKGRATCAHCGYFAVGSE